MSALRTAAAGMLGLALLDTVVSSTASANRVGTLLTAVSKVVSHLLSPTVAAIPDLRKHGGADVPTAPSTDTTATTDSSLLPASWTTSPSVASLET